MNKDRAIQMLERMQDPEPYEPQITSEAFDALQMAIEALKYSEVPNSSDTISRQAAIDAVRATLLSWSYMPEWRDEKIIEAIAEMPPAQPERTCVNCGRTVNNGGWYADGGARCPIEEHYALPKDGYCHLWEKRNVTDDDYPERRTDE